MMSPQLSSGVICRARTKAKTTTKETLCPSLRKLQARSSSRTTLALRTRFGVGVGVESSEVLSRQVCCRRCLRRRRTGRSASSPSRPDLADVAEEEEELDQVISAYGRGAPKLLLTRGRWQPVVLERAEATNEIESIKLRGRLMLKNTSKRQELFIPDITASATLLSRGPTEGIRVRTKVIKPLPPFGCAFTTQVSVVSFFLSILFYLWIKKRMLTTILISQISPRHDLADGYGSPDSIPREDSYWSTYIVQGRGKTFIDLTVVIGVEETSRKARLSDSEVNRLLTLVTSCCIEVNYGCYGPLGLAHCKQHIVLPLHFPDPSLPPRIFNSSEFCETNENSENSGKKAKKFSVYSIPTHLLFHDDDPLDVIAKYVKPHAIPGDILAVAETPLALMQGRYRHPVW